MSTNFTVQNVVTLPGIQVRMESFNCNLQQVFNASIRESEQFEPVHLCLLSPSVVRFSSLKYHFAMQATEEVDGRYLFSSFDLVFTSGVTFADIISLNITLVVDPK